MKMVKYQNYWRRNLKGFYITVIQLRLYLFQLMFHSKLKTKSIKYIHLYSGLNKIISPLCVIMWNFLYNNYKLVCRRIILQIQQRYVLKNEHLKNKQAPVFKPINNLLKNAQLIFLINSVLSSLNIRMNRHKHLTAQYRLAFLIKAYWKIIWMKRPFKTKSKNKN
jgi:hypothetical protein